MVPLYSMRLHDSLRLFLGSVSDSCCVTPCACTFHKSIRPTIFHTEAPLPQMACAQTLNLKFSFLRSSVLNCTCLAKRLWQRTSASALCTELPVASSSSLLPESPQWESRSRILPSQKLKENRNVLQYFIPLNHCEIPLNSTVYRDRLKSMQILLSRTQAGPGRTGKQEQEQTSRNHVQAF